jgi:K(+)-stimulated pyrophosphate-energized sodium pump
MRIMMLVASARPISSTARLPAANTATPTNEFRTPADFAGVITSISIIATSIVSNLIIPDLGGDTSQWWKLASIISVTLAGAVIPELVKAFTSTESRHVNGGASAKEGGASGNLRLCRNFSGYWLGLTMVGLMSVATCSVCRTMWATMIAASIARPGAFGFHVGR